MVLINGTELQKISMLLGQSEETKFLNLTKTNNLFKDYSHLQACLS